MTDVDKFIEGFLEHRAAYDPAAARAYYLRTRELKGRKPGTPKLAPRKRVEEDEVPMKSPSGAKLLDYDGRGPGRATYTDGSTFDGNGWNTTGHTINTRLKAAQEKLMESKTWAKKIPDPAERKRQTTRIEKLQKELDVAKNKRRGKAF